ncbi:hypothetical protein ACD661_05070 [Legionella lytica]|uniref:Uncharacterized protein n=1 Tax=Legionella lytica TaxID=96232 RepID=A0ABW8D7K3_9GAMM
MKEKVSSVRTGSVISVGIVSLGTVVAVCVAPPLALPLGAKLGFGVAGLIGSLWAAGDTAVNHFSGCAAKNKGADDDRDSIIEQLTRRVTSLEEEFEKDTSARQSINQAIDEVRDQQSTTEHRQNTLELQREMDKKEVDAKISMVREEVDSHARRISTLERRTSSHVSKRPTAFPGTSFPTPPVQEQTDDIPEGVSGLLAKHGLHRLNPEDNQPSDDPSPSKRREPTGRRI